MRDAIVQLCCVFYKAVLTDPIGSSQELTLRATIAKLGSVSSRQLLFHVHLINFLEEGVRGMYDFTWSHVRSMTCVPATRDPLDPCGTFYVNCPSLWLTCSTRHLGHSSLITVDQACAPSAKTVSGTSCQLIGNDVTTYQERLASYLAKMLQRIRNVLKVTRLRCYNVSGTSRKLLDEDVTTYQERIESYLEKMLQRIRNVLKVIWRRCYNISGTYWKLLDEDVTTYQESRASYSKKMLQRIRNVLQVTWRRCYNVSGTYWKLLG